MEGSEIVATSALPGKDAKYARLYGEYFSNEILLILMW